MTTGHRRCYVCDHLWEGEARCPVCAERYGLQREAIDREALAALVKRRGVEWVRKELESC